jgi:hypothetical protein
MFGKAPTIADPSKLVQPNETVMQWLAFCLLGSSALAWCCCTIVTILRKVLWRECLDTKLQHVMNTDI